MAGQEGFGTLRALWVSCPLQALVPPAPAVAEVDVRRVPQNVQQEQQCVGGQGQLGLDASAAAGSMLWRAVPREWRAALAAAAPQRPAVPPLQPDRGGLDTRGGGLAGAFGVGLACAIRAGCRAVGAAPSARRRGGAPGWWRIQPLH